MEIKLIKHPTEEDWALCKACTLVTVGLKAKAPPSVEWKKKMLDARHSPIRELKFVFLLNDVPYWVAMHLVRHHVGCQPYVRSQRNDRQDKYDRTKAPQDAPVDMMWSINGEAMLTIANKRLCNMAAPETREVVEKMCALVARANPEFAPFLVPICEREGFVCHEFNGCGRCAHMEVEE